MTVAAAFLLNEEKGPEVEVPILGAVEGHTALSAPPLFWFELLNVPLTVMGAIRRGRTAARRPAYRSV